MFLDNEPIDKQRALQESPNFYKNLEKNICAFCQIKKPEFDIISNTLEMTPICKECNIIRDTEYPGRLPLATPRNTLKRYCSQLKRNITKFKEFNTSWGLDNSQFLTQFGAILLVTLSFLIWKIVNHN